MDGVIMGMFSQSEILLMIAVVSVLLICITVLTIIDIKEYLKAKKGLVKEELDNEYEELEVKPEPVQVMEVEDTPNVLISEIKEDTEAYFEEMEDEHFEVKKEVNPIIAEDEDVFIPKVEVKETKVEIPKVVIEEKPIEVEIPKVVVEEKPIEVELPKQEDKKEVSVFEELEETINNLPNKKDDITNFEAEQERTAIISLDELMKRSDELYNDNEEMQYDDGNEPISIDEVIKMFSHEEEKVENKFSQVKEEIKEETKEIPKVYDQVVEERIPYSKKETIPFISSVYGIEKDENALEFENTATYEKLDRENYKDFVAKLREMNENK